MCFYGDQFLSKLICVLWNSRRMDPAAYAAKHCETLENMILLHRSVPSVLRWSNPFEISISTLLLLMAQKTACVSWSTAWRRSLAMNCVSVSIAQRVMRLSTITATI